MLHSSLRWRLDKMLRQMSITFEINKLVVRTKLLSFRPKWTSNFVGKRPQDNLDVLLRSWHKHQGERVSEWVNEVSLDLLFNVAFHTYKVSTIKTHIHLRIFFTLTRIFRGGGGTTFLIDTSECVRVSLSLFQDSGCCWTSSRTSWYWTLPLFHLSFIWSCLLLAVRSQSVT